MTTHRFKATLERLDIRGAWTFISVPFSVEEKFGTRSRVAVKGSVNGVEFRSSLMPQGGGTHILVVNKQLRDKAGVEVGIRRASSLRSIPSRAWRKCLMSFNARSAPMTTHATLSTSYPTRTRRSTPTSYLKPNVPQLVSDGRRGPYRCSLRGAG